MGAGKGRIKSFYDKWVLFRVNEDYLKCFVKPTVIILFLLLIVLGVSQRPEVLSEYSHKYLKAAPVLCTIVFWPFIIIDNSYRFYRTYENLSELVKGDKGKEVALYEWYEKNAKHSFTFERISKSRIRHHIGITINSLIILFLGCFFVFIDSIKCGRIGLFALVVVSAIICVLLLQQRNLSITQFTVCCGLAYYVYLCKYASDRFQPLFLGDFWNTVLLLVVAIVFFIAGSAISPMISALIAFYRDLPGALIGCDIKPSDLSQRIDQFNSIRKYFVHLAIISLVAFFQLFCLVYILGIFDKSALTKVLFVLGSLFPLLMYCASDIMYKRFMHKQYIDYIKKIKIDEKIDNAYASGDIGAIQQLVALKEKLCLEFEERPNIQLIIALASPIVTSILSFILDYYGNKA